MEKVAWRFVLTLAIAAVVMGSSIAYLGWQRQAEMQERWLEASNEADASKSLCGTTASDELGRKACFDLWAEETRANNWMLASSQKAGSRYLVSLAVAILLPPVLFGLFFLLRWILTGRWRSKPQPATAG